MEMQRIQKKYVSKMAPKGAKTIKKKYKKGLLYKLDPLIEYFNWYRVHGASQFRQDYRNHWKDLKATKKRVNSLTVV